jgi:hypothetical protein
MTTTDVPDDMAATPDSSDVVTGPVGSASLRDPASSGPEGAELDRLPAIDADSQGAEATAIEPVPSRGGGAADEPNQAIRQLEAILANLTTYARPALREIAARAAEVAAKAAEAAGPVAHKAAGMTEEVGGRLAAKGREIASDLRSDQPSGPGSGDTGGSPSS